MSASPVTSPPSPPVLATVRAHLEAAKAHKVRIGNLEGSLAGFTAVGALLAGMMDLEAYRIGDRLIDPYDGGCLLTILE